MFKKMVFNRANERKVFSYIDHLNGGEMEVPEAVVSVIRDVRKNGDAALLKYTKKFDGVDVGELRVPAKDIKKAYSLVDKKLFKPLKRAAANIYRFHRMQKDNIRGYVFRNKGYKITQKYLPVGSAGLYIPGSQAPLFSTVLMAGIPAKIAGVKRVVIISPPRHNRDVNPYVLVAADMIGITEIYRVGGSQGIAALAYGTASIPRVDKIAGPGNIYSTMAKKYLFGAVGIDALNGPSEITVIADRTADPVYIACDLLAQAEHVNGHSFLITDSNSLALKVEEEVKKAKIKVNVAVVMVSSMGDAVKVANYKGPEHLLVAAKNSRKIISAITNSPAIFSGNYSPVAFGDYMAGSNHILPTNGTSRFFSGLSVLDFMKHTHVVECTKQGIRGFGEDTEALAAIETLSAHVESIRVRREK